MSPQRRVSRVSAPWLTLAVAKRLVSDAEVAAAMAHAEAAGTDEATVLLQHKTLTEEQLGALKAEAAGVAYVEVEDYQIDPAVLRLVPEFVARKHQVLPLYRFDNALTIAMADPWDVVAIDAVRSTTKLPIVHALVGSPGAIHKAVERHYGLQVVDDASKAVGPRPAAPRGGNGIAAAGESGLDDAVSDVSIIKLVDALLSEALESRASDIHLEPDGEHTRVRVRIDGVLHEVKLFPIGMQDALASRVKILAKLDITEHRLPQDGHLALTVDGRSVDLRISTYPTVSGENLVLRILDQSAVALHLTHLGLASDVMTQVQQLIQRPHGMLLVTGPTGSGKTTTLYAAIAELNSITKNVMTIEDPVEYRVPLIRQTQINLKAGVTFAAGLRSLLRQDPDVIMVGEIRDAETAEIAMHAALTGHLVLSTLHTNDAAGAVGRLLDMGVESYLLASTLLGVIGQRLVRKICPHCQEGGRPPKALTDQYPQLTVLYRGRGCRRCLQTGFLGRVGVFEFLIVEGAVQAQITSKVASEALHTLAIQHGMRTMRADGLLKVQQGLTTLDELDRVVPPN